MEEWFAKNMRRKGIWIAIVLVIGSLGMFAAEAGWLLVVDAPEPSDVILVLAGETDRRPARALQLLDQGYGRRVVIDVPADARIYEFQQIELAKKYIQGLPKAAAVRVCPIEGLSTREESRDAELCLASEAGSRILIVTSEFHTRRSLSIFRHEIPGKHFSSGGGARREAVWNTDGGTHRQWAKTCRGRVAAAGLVDGGRAVELSQNRAVPKTRTTR